MMLQTIKQQKIKKYRNKKKNNTYIIKIEVEIKKQRKNRDKNKKYIDKELHR